MKKKILFFFSALLLTVGLVFADTGKDYKSGKPWIDSNLKENVVSSQRPSPKDDYHLYVNYDWLLKNEIPEGEKGINSFSRYTVLRTEDFSERGFSIRAKNTDSFRLRKAISFFRSSAKR